MSRPKIKIQKQSSDYLWELFAFLGAILLIALPIYYYNQLPDTIPLHYGPNGEPDRFGDKIGIWTVPIIGLICFVGLYILNHFPHLFNYTEKITPDNAEYQYIKASRLIRYINTIIVYLFLYICHVSIQIALGNESKLNVFYMLLFIALIFGVIFWYLMQRKSQV